MISSLLRRPTCAVAFFLCIHAALLAWAATRHSPSIDEVGHMAAGLGHWHFGRFDLYRVNPPLARVVATAPVSLMKPQMNWHNYPLMTGQRPEFESGEQFIASNGERSFWLFTVARWASIPFSLLGGYVCYRWAKELYGAAGGMLSLMLWSFCPTIIAHGQMITPDVAAAALGATACYAFWRWLREPAWTTAIVSGFALGFAELTKTTFIFLYPVWLLAWLFWRLTGERQGASIVARHQARSTSLCTRQARVADLRCIAQFTAMAALSIYIINAGYGFEDTLRPLGNYRFISRMLAGDQTPGDSGAPPVNRFSGSKLARIPVPLPANYVLGIDHQKREFENRRQSYLRGEWRYGGWWYYYLYGLAVKVPLGTWMLFFLASGAGRASKALRRHGAQDALAGAAEDKCDALRSPHCDPRTWRDEVVLLLPAVTILALVSSQTGINHHLRYVLPAFPFLYIWTGRLGSALDGFRARRNCLLKWTVAASLAWSCASSLWYYPHLLSYFNELAGGPLGGRWHMLDSNLDWGQDLLYLRRWLDKNPQAAPLGLAYFGYFDPRTAGISFSLPPRGPDLAEFAGDEADEAPRTLAAARELGPKPGWYAVSLMMLHGYKFGIPDGVGRKFLTDPPCFTYFQKFDPVDRAGYSIYIYHLEPRDVDRVRRELHLPGLASEAVTISEQAE